ncbi:hypothetical protein [Oerskovia jenensis]|uniref:hypothetical protein n=1 Tax=Oerskovia jenensis TaxID=162169 RepID=UPI0036D78AA7
MARSPAREVYPPLDADEPPHDPGRRRRAGLHGPVTSGWLLVASVSQLGAFIVVLWSGLRAFPEMTLPAAALLVGAVLLAHWSTSLAVFAVGRARFRCLERRYVTWLDGLSADQRAEHCRRAQHRLEEHRTAPRHWVVPADW